ncbi:hypothetical protein PAXINDRAFT_13844 [Paxillus involutus ATCC 200175]|uniref:Uncharacterized protein n=1 Tax=Paxillus involutus ATCC 200175 TaxID=664439 RepID=A0A0C9U0K9_PAXIN|nr:hypothetical protein PAXINDRAFT_13844 [Paxillus involutus ATCC 200175]
MDEFLLPAQNTTYLLRTWCDKLMRYHHAEPHRWREYIVTRMTLHKYLWSYTQHEFVILEVVALGDIDNPQAERSHISIGRHAERLRNPISGDQPPRGFLSRLGIRGLALDQVTVLLHPWQEQTGLRFVSWTTTADAPRLVHVAKLLFWISSSQPYYDVIFTQCLWFAKAIYMALRGIYDGNLETELNKTWMQLASLSLPLPPDSSFELIRILIRAQKTLLGWDMGVTEAA